MQIDLKSGALFTPREQLTLESVNAAKMGRFKLINKMLALTQNNKTVGKFAPSQINWDVFGDRLIAYTYKPKVGKEIVFEAVGQKEDFKELGKMLAVHNRSANYKSPLQLNFSTTCKESVLTSTNDANLRGFLNLFVVLSIITYSRLILINLKEYKSLFVNLVG